VRGSLTPRLIFETALAVIDADGVKALTMRRVAGDLGVEAMSLYYHVPNKDALVAGVLDLLVAEAELPDGAVDAEGWIRGTAAAFRELARIHPQAFPLLLSRPLPLTDPVAAQRFETGLAAFAALGRSPEEAFAEVQVISLALLGLGLLESVSVTGEDDAPESQVAALPADRLPLLSALTSASVDLDRFWATLVDTLVRGVRTA
jgi:AcrR family transcriptional regulator